MIDTTKMTFCTPKISNQLIDIDDKALTCSCRFGIWAQPWITGKWILNNNIWQTTRTSLWCILMGSTFTAKYAINFQPAYIRLSCECFWLRIKMEDKEVWIANSSIRFALRVTQFLLSYLNVIFHCNLSAVIKHIEMKNKGVF